jgi:hypothetical protein
MDKARIEAILSGKPVTGRKGQAAKPVLKPDAKIEQCLPALNRLRAASSTGQRSLVLTSSQLPPCF